MCSPVRLCCALGIALLCSPVSAWSAPKAKPKTAAAKKSAKEISADDGLQKQMDWENKLLGPNHDKKIDLVKIQKLQAEETARREKQERLDKVDRERKEREAALAAQRKDVKSPSSREVPTVEPAAPMPTKPSEKRDDAFVDRLLKEGKSGEKKRTPAVSNDDVDQLLAKAKQDKGASIALKPTSNHGGKGGGSDSVDQLLATAESQQSIKTTTKRASDAEAVSAEAAAREESLRAVRLAAAKAQEERERNKPLAIPDAAMLRQQASPGGVRVEASAVSAAGRGRGAGLDRASVRGAPSGDGAWKDPFASEGSGPPASRSARVSTAVAPTSARQSASSPRPTPSIRPAANSGGGGDAPATWTDPFDAAAGAKVAPTPASGAAKAKPSKPIKRPPHWKDPFA